MASDQEAIQGTAYACKCLNVRITTSAPTSAPPDYPRDPAYTPVFVKDDGITVNHTQVTVRSTSKPVPIPSSSRYSRFTALTCLFCDLPIYRVHHAILLEIEGNDASLLPSEEWVEREIMKTATGWIDVHKDALVGAEVSKAASSAAYAPLFSVILPAMDSLDSNEEEHAPKKDSPSEESVPPTYLPHIKPVFLPPPFTPSNPVFGHLAAIANEHSQAIRAAAEQRIQDFINAEAAGITEKEQAIKRQAESLWKEFSRHLASVQQERGRVAARAPLSPTRGTSNGALSPTLPSSSVTVRNFIPTTLPSSVLHVPSASHPRVSALSASLATSTFHHPRETRKQASSGEDTSESSDSGASNTPSTRSGSTTLVHSTHQGEESNVLQYKRNINDDINTQASYRYFVNLEEDMRRYKSAQQDVTTQEQPSATELSQQAGPSLASTVKPANGADAKKVQIIEPVAGQDLKPESETTPSRGRDKGKRRVTFDSQPATVSISKSDKETAPVEDPREIIFRLDDDVVGEDGETPSEEQVTLPLLEQPAPRPVHIRKRSLNAANDAFHSLRPSSLPAPSHFRPLRSQPGVDSSSQGVMMGLPRSPAPTSTPPKQEPSSSAAAPLNARDADIMKLVAADTPSHRGTWTPGSEQWISFTRRDANDESEDESDAEDEAAARSAPVAVRRKIVDVSDEEVEDTEELEKPQLPIVGSLPINIKKAEPPKFLSLASYVQPNAIPEEQEVNGSSSSSVPANGKRLSSTAIRKAAYAEKDRARSMDPGPLDFVAELEEDADDEDDDGISGGGEGEKARNQALRILKARSELPEEGMWRSLA